MLVLETSRLLDQSNSTWVFVSDLRRAVLHGHHTQRMSSGMLPANYSMGEPYSTKKESIADQGCVVSLILPVLRGSQIYLHRCGPFYKRVIDMFESNADLVRLRLGYMNSVRFSAPWTIAV